MVAQEADKETASAGLEAPGNTSAGAGAGEGVGSPVDPDGRPAAKAVFVGDSGAGKTALLMRFSQDIFHEAGKATVGIDLQTREVPLSAGGSISLQLWDTAGQEQFHALTTSYFRQVHCRAHPQGTRMPKGMLTTARSQSSTQLQTGMLTAACECCAGTCGGARVRRDESYFV